MEIWKDILGFEGRYQVSTEGKVRSLDRVEKTSAGWSRNRKGRVLRSSSGNGQGHYCSVALGRNVYRLVHRLVAEAFLQNIDNLPHVNHKDKDTKNNNVNNLEWVTPTMNMNHSTGKKFKLTNGIYVKEFESLAEAAYFLSSNCGNVSRLVSKKKYNHIKGWKLYEPSVSQL